MQRALRVPCVAGILFFTGCGPKVAETSALDTICGSNNLQAINSYDGQLGEPVGYAKLHKFAVGALTDSSTATNIKYCTGTLVGPDLFMTAAHCIDGDTLHHFVALNFEQAPGSTGLLTQQYFPITAVVENGGGLDYAIVRVSGMPGLTYGWATVRTNQTAIGELLTVIQHPNGGPKAIDVGHVLSLTNNFVRYGDLDTEPGSSGAGILDGRGNLVAIHTTGGCTATGGSNSGTRLSAAAANPVVARLAALTLPFRDGSTVALSLAGADSSLLLAADVATHGVSLSRSDRLVAYWRIADLSDGSFHLSVNDGQGHTAYLDGRSADGRVVLRDRLDDEDFGAKWRIVRTEDDRYLLRTVGQADGPRWLGGGIDGSARLTSDAIGWQISVR